jgi:hypothetical protein
VYPSANKFAGALLCGCRHRASQYEVQKYALVVNAHERRNQRYRRNRNDNRGHLCPSFRRTGWHYDTFDAEYGRLLDQVVQAANVSVVSSPRGTDTQWTIDFYRKFRAA